MSTRPLAVRLAEAIDPLTRYRLDNLTCSAAANEMRRLHALNQELVHALQPFVLANSSEEFMTLVVRSSDITKARAAIAKEGGAA